MNANFTWSKSVADEVWQTVRIYEKVSAGYSKVAEVAGAAASAVVPNLSVGTHTYVARSFNGQAESGDSNEVQAVVLKSPSAPTMLAISLVVG